MARRVPPERPPWAASAASSLGVEVIAASAADPSHAKGSIEEEVARVEAGLDTDWCGPLRALPSCSTRMGTGDPREVLTEIAADVDADLVVVGSTGTGWFPAVHLGHVGHYLASHAEHPTVVVPPQARGAALDSLVVGRRRFGWQRSCNRARRRPAHPR